MTESDGCQKALNSWLGEIILAKADLMGPQNNTGNSGIMGGVNSGMLGNFINSLVGGNAMGMQPGTPNSTARNPQQPIAYNPSMGQQSPLNYSMGSMQNSGSMNAQPQQNNLSNLIPQYNQSRLGMV